MAIVEDFLTPAGNDPYLEFLSELAKHGKTQELYTCDYLIKDLRDSGCELLKTGELKFLEKNYKLYELKARGRKSRIGIYICHIAKQQKFIVLGGFLKASAKTRQTEIDTFVGRIKSFRERYE